MSSQSYFDKSIHKRVLYKDPLFIITLNLRVGDIVGGAPCDNTQERAALYWTVRRDMSLKRQFINAVQTIIAHPYKTLRNIFTKKTLVYNNEKLDYTLNDHIALNALKKIMNNDDATLMPSLANVATFPMVDSIDMVNDATLLQNQQKNSRLLYKTYSGLTPVVAIWWQFLGKVPYDLSTELESLELAGYTVLAETTPPDDNPLGIKYMWLGF